MLGFFSDIGNIIDIILLIIPILVILFLIFKFVLPKKPALGIGLAGGVGLLGYFLVKRRLKIASDVEKKIAEYNQMMKEFKDKQKTRYEAVTANKEIIKNLEKQKKKLEKDEENYKDEIKLLDAELEDRRQLNKNLLEDTGSFLVTTENQIKKYENLINQYKKQAASSDHIEPVSETTESGEGSTSDIEISGYRLMEV